jgi:hypothetical protein
MIRVNLLRPIGTREGRVEALIRTGGVSRFISRREVLLGLGCLVVAAGALLFQFGGPADAEPAVAAQVPPTWVPQQPLIRDIDAGRPAAPPGTALAPNGGQNVVAAGGVEPTQGDAIASSPVEALGTDTNVESKPATPSSQAESPLETAPAADVPALQQLVVSSESGALRIFALTGTLPEYTTFRLDGPKRIVVDLPGVRLTLPHDQRDHKPDHPQVSRIRAGQYQTNPPRARIVLDVASYPDVEALPQFNGLYLVVTEIPR